MKLDDFLKVKKVRCIKADKLLGGYLAIGRVYDVKDIKVHLYLDNGGEPWGYDSSVFEPVLDSAENPLQNIELTPEFEAVEPVLADNCQVNIQDIGTNILDTNADIEDTPRFKVGDKVYCSGFSVLFKVLKVANTNGVLLEHCAFEGGMYADAKYVCHATPENYELLCKLYPHIEFEQPPKPLTGSDLARAMFDAGHEYVVGRVGNHVGVYYTWSEGAGHFFEVCGTGTFDIEPIDPRTGEPLTQAVLDE